MAQTATTVIVCGNCGAKNRIPTNKFGAAATCGRCKSLLDTSPEAELTYKLRCTSCGAQNRVAARKLHAEAKCGKCKAPLDTKAVSAAQPMMISDMNFESQVVKSPLPVLVYAWSPS